MEFPKTNYSYCEHNSIEKLDMPPIDFWPIYSWGWKGEITNDGIVSRLDDMLKRGIKRIYVITLPAEFSGIQNENETIYLSDEFMERMKFLVEETKKRGMKLWLYDEGGFPSGSANEMVIKNNPELEPYTMDKDGNFHPRPSYGQDYPDLLNKKSTEKFIEYTHQRYKDYFKESFSDNFMAVFTDEPHARCDGDELVWTGKLEERFKEKFGYDIREHLKELFDKSLTDDASRKVRSDYRDLLGELFTENYFLPIKEWCHENGILSTGHLAGEDIAFGNALWGYYHILRTLRMMDIPGVDAIWRQIFPGEEKRGVEPYSNFCANNLFPRYASSAAHQIGARLALTESYAIYGAGVTYDQMRWVYNFQVVRGINVLNPMNTCYSHAGKYGATSGLPNFASPAPGCSDLSEFNLWASRASYVMSAGKPIVDSALYMPFRDIWPADEQARIMAESFEKLGAELESRGCDIDIIDDDTILAAKIKDGALLIGDALYQTLYFQDGVTITDDVQAKLDLFRENGGKIIICTNDYAIYPIIEDKDANLRATRRKIKEGTLYYITNEAYNAKSGEVLFLKEDAECAYEINLLTGEKKVVSVNPYKYDISLGGEVVLLFNFDKKEVADKDELKLENSLKLTDFYFSRKEKIHIVPEGLISEKIVEEPVKIKVGDWRKIAGEFFSGDAEYKTTFAFEKKIPEKALLDLGEVGYSCEVYLNGKSLGVKIFSPFIFELSGLKKENELLIRVSNTMANAYADAKYEEWIPDFEPDYMKKLELEFEKESLRSGLFGPVLIKW